MLDSYLNLTNEPNQASTQKLGNGVIHFQSANASQNLPVVLLGASARSAAQSLARAGITCVTIDQFGDQDTRQCAAESQVVKTNQQLTERLADYSGHPIVCVGQWPGMIQAALHCDRQRMPSIAAWQAACSLDQLGIAASRAGLNVPRTTSEQPLGENAARFLSKQVIHSGGLGVRWNAMEPSLAGADTIYQQWMTGRTLGATFLATKDNVQLLGTCRTLFGRIAEYPFVYRGSFGPVDCIDDSNQSKLCLAAGSIASESGLLGVFNIDFIQSRGGRISLLEVNPRWSASSEIIERSLTESGTLNPTQSLLGISIDAMRGQHLPILQPPIIQPRIGKPAQWIKRIVYAKRKMQFNYQQALAATNEMGSIHDIPIDGELIEPKSPCCTLISKVVSGNPHWWAKYRTAVENIRQPTS